MQWLETERPELVEGYKKLYAGKYAPGAYRTEVKRVLDGFKTKYAASA
jgi:hypothetical protein